MSIYSGLAGTGFNQQVSLASLSSRLSLHTNPGNVPVPYLCSSLKENRKESTSAATELGQQWQALTRTTCNGDGGHRGFNGLFNNGVKKSGISRGCVII